MKKTLLALATTLTLGASAFFITSCGTDDPCAKVECGTHGTCNEGTCDCATGYEQDTNGRCDLTWTSKFAGKYTCKDKCTDSKGTVSTYDYEATISELSTLKNIEITNFAGFALTSKAITLDSKTTFAIDYTDASGRIFKGTGTYVKSSVSTTADVINMNYTVTFSDGTTDSCVSVFTKK